MKEKYCKFGCGRILNEECGDHVEVGSCARCE